MTMKTKTGIAGAILAIALLSGCASHPNNMAGSERFVQQASAGNNFEIAESKLALKKSRNPQVRAFAAKMIKDHAATAASLRNAVAASTVDSSNIVSGVDEAHLRKYNKLKTESGRAFDTDYIADQREAHSDAVRLFRYYRAAGKSASLRQFAIDTLPDLESHEQRIYALQP